MGWNLRKAHKWMAILVGVFLFLWLVSGILMVLPQFQDRPPGIQTGAPFDWRKASLSPGQAISVIEARLGHPADVKRVELFSLLNTGLYRISLKNGRFFLVNSMTGLIEELTSERAELILRQQFSAPIRIKTKQEMGHYNWAYLWGPLPVMRFELADPPGVTAYVSLGNGAIRWSSQWTSVRGVVESFHTFDPVKLFTDRKMIPRMTLIILSLVGIGVVVSGALLIWRPFRR